MNKQTLTLKVIDIKRLKNSYVGNPNFRFTLECKNGHIIKADTMNNSSVGYRVTYGMEGKRYDFELKVNKKSNRVLDFNLVEEA